MLRSGLIAVALCAGTWTFSAQLLAQETYTFTKDTDLRQLEAQRLQLVLLRRDDFRHVLRQKDLQIGLAQADVEAFRRELTEYVRFNRHFVDPKPFAISEIQARLGLTKAELLVNHLQQE